MFNKPDAHGVVLPVLLPIFVVPPRRWVEGGGGFASRRAGCLPAKAALTSPGNVLMSTINFVDYAGFMALLQ